MAKSIVFWLGQHRRPAVATVENNAHEPGRRGKGLPAGRRACRLPGLVAACCVLAAIGAVPQAPAQQGDTPAFSANNIMGPPAQQLPLSVTLPKEDYGDYALVMFRGLPKGFKISAGIDLGEAWAVSLRDLPDLTLTAPADYEGAFLLEVLFVRERNAAPEKRVVAVDIRSDSVLETSAEAEPAPEEPAETPEATASPSPQDQLQDVPAAQSIEVKPTAVEESLLLQQAAEMMKDGNVGGARLLYEELAARGSARGALGMAQSFDPLFLERVVVVGLKPDIEQAKHWYRKAAELGNRDASDRLSALADTVGQ